MNNQTPLATARAALRELREPTDDDVERLGQWLWDNCAEDERTGLLSDDPRRIAAVALRWPELRRMADEAQPTAPAKPSCTCGYIAEPWIKMDHAIDCPARPVTPMDPINILGIGADAQRAVEAQPDGEATAEHHTVDGTRYLCHTDDHYCPETQPAQPETGAAVSIPPQFATQAADESPHVYMTAIRHQAGWAHDFLKAGRLVEAMEHVEAIERLAAVTRRAVAGKAEGGGE
jgi:hypothetical protein